MTQIAARSVTQGSAPLVAPLVAPIPRPRGASEPMPTQEPFAAADRRAATWPMLTLDTAVAGVLAIAATATGRMSFAAALAAAAAWPLMLLAGGHYRRRFLGEDRAARVRRALLTGVRGVLVILATTPWLTQLDTVGLALLLACFSVASCVVPLVTGRQRPRLVLAGDPHEVREAMVDLLSHETHEVVAVCLTHSSAAPLGAVPTYVGLEQAALASRHHEADALVVLPGARMSPAELRRLHWAVGTSGTDLCLGTGLADVSPSRVRARSTGALGVVQVDAAELVGPRRWAKGGFDRVAAALGLLALLPVLLIVATAIRLDSPGPAIYRQQRVGRNGHLFTMYKFRSMSCSADRDRTGLDDANESDGVLFKIQQDPRITRIGRYLRRYSVDEVPQLWNVVLGQMSLVGPRPALPEEVARYEVDPRRRLVVKPGLTGLWQVSGRSDLSWEETVRLDVSYVDNWSLGRDVSILGRTVRAVLTHRGAY